MTTQVLPLDDRATCAELFDFACALADELHRMENPPFHVAELLNRFEFLRADINTEENAS